MDCLVDQLPHGPLRMTPGNEGVQMNCCEQGFLNNVFAANIRAALKWYRHRQSTKTPLDSGEGSNVVKNVHALSLNAKVTLMKASRWIWFVWLLVLLCYVVPYTVLTNVQAWYGSFLFWAVMGALVIVANIFLTKDFEEQ